MSLLQYNNAILAIQGEFLPYEQAIINHVQQDPEHCELLVYGNCFHCQTYLSFRYGIPCIVQANAPELDYKKEQTLSFRLASAFTKHNYIEPRLLQRLRTAQRARQTIPTPAVNTVYVNVPCNLEHTVDHVCPPCTLEHNPQCNREHLDQHACPTTCNREHLDHHICQSNMPVNNVCFHLECLGTCTMSPNAHHPQSNTVPEIPGQFNQSFGQQLLALELPFPTSLTTPPPPPIPISQTPEPTIPVEEEETTTICDGCQHETTSRHHLFLCPIGRNQNVDLVQSPSVTTQRSRSRRSRSSRSRSRSVSPAPSAIPVAHPHPYQGRPYIREDSDRMLQTFSGLSDPSDPQDLCPHCNEPIDSVHHQQTCPHGPLVGPPTPPLNLGRFGSQPNNAFGSSPSDTITGYTTNRRNRVMPSRITSPSSSAARFPTVTTFGASSSRPAFGSTPNWPSTPPSSTRDEQNFIDSAFQGTSRFNPFSSD